MANESRVGIEAYATITPIVFEMDMPSKSERRADSKKDLDQLWVEAVNYGSNGRRGKGEGTSSPTPKGTKTTLATPRFPVAAEALVGFKAKVAALPSAWEKAMVEAGFSPNQLVNTELMVSKFKQEAKRILEEAERQGVHGYEAIVDCIRRVNEHKVVCVKVEFFLKRVDVTEFEGSKPGKDGKFYQTTKVRKLYMTTQPSIELVSRIIQESLLSTEVIAFNNDLVLRRVRLRNLDGSYKAGKQSSIVVTHVGYEGFSSEADKAVQETLRRLRAPKRE